MKAIVVREYGSEDVLKLEEVPTPETAEGQVLVRVKAAGVNPVDTYVREGHHPSTPPLPFTPGKDGAGVVESVGDGVDKVSPGDRVYLAGAVNGTYGEFALCSEDQVWALPDEASFEQGAGLFVPYATAYRGMFNRAKVQPGETLLVHGASGAVGIASVQWAKSRGVKVFGTAGSKDGLSLVAETGADGVFDHSSADYFEKILEATDGKGVDVIVEMLANKNLERDFDVLAKFGRIVVVGSRGSLEFNPRLTMGKDASILGMSLFNGTKEEFAEIHGQIFDGLKSGHLAPVIGKTFALGEAGEAHREVIESKAYGKIVLLPDAIL